MNNHNQQPIIAITGIGITTPLGSGVATNWEKLCAGTSGISTITRFDTTGLRTTIAGTVSNDNDDSNKFCAADHTYNLAEQAGIEALAQAKINIGEINAPLFLAIPPVELEWWQRLKLHSQITDTETGHQTLLAAARNNSQIDNKYMFQTTQFGFLADKLGKKFGTTGLPISLTTACASGATAIQMGAEAIRRGETNRALCMASDGCIGAETVIRFSLLSALSTNNDEPTKASRPFSKGRDGFVMAEGGAALVLESLASAEKRQAPILAILKGCGEKSDDFHRTRSSPDAMPATTAMQTCIADAKLKYDDIDFINAHGTSTPENDKMEYLALQKVFAEKSATIPVSSNKSMIGHTLSAAGAIEAVFSILTLQHQTLPPTINYDTPDPDIQLNIVGNKSQQATVQNVLSNSFGFGGQNTCLIFSKADSQG